MRNESIHNFLFHPWVGAHSQAQRALSVATIIALSVLTGGLFAVAFAFINWRDRQIKMAAMTPRVQNSVSPILGASSQPSLSVSPMVDPFRLNSADSVSVKGDRFVAADQAKVDRIKQRQAKQLQDFKNWALANQWQKIHDAHYDWWMFPVERPSAQQGEAYAVGREEVNALKADPAFMQSYREGVALVVQAWGWDLENEQAILVANPQVSGQKWTGYGVRLAKMSDSLLLFGEIGLHKKLQVFFTQHCLPQQDQVPISNLKWLKSTLGEVK
ncbi:hypothetical protein [Candidatus Protochlamydia phocaeensis]|uniref:hypothetical protein n=1 Tax=Candidatus Protochlamydia phocaeensis TaxID=1414722 RepID=UPI000837C499|nr:hypothetical protein [Candidatus Protochlamydia phocaeensis]